MSGLLWLVVVAQQRGIAAGREVREVGEDRTSRLFERSGDLITMLIDGGHTHTDLQHAYQHGRANGGRIRRAVFCAWTPGTLAPGVTADSALDAYATICNIHTYTILHDERGYTPAQIERWWIDVLAQLLLG